MIPYLSVCAIYRDEAPYLLEWIEFHRLVGVERFFLYDNESTDNHRELLAPYVDAGIVILTEWHLFPGQIPAYENCLKEHQQKSRWIAFIDLDEFLFSPTGRSLPEMLVDYEAWPGIGAARHVFGTSGHESAPPGLIIENYVHRAWNPHTIKSIVDPTQVVHCGNPHFFSYRNGFAVDENKILIDEPPYHTTKSPTCSLLRINHYVTKSEVEFQRKLSRPRADVLMLRSLKFAPPVWNALKDETITSYVPRLHDALSTRSI